jgi:hypothetical protein
MYHRLMWDPDAAVRNALLLDPAVPRRVAAGQIFRNPSPSVHVALASRADLTARHLVWLERYSRHDPADQYKRHRASGKAMRCWP